MTYMITFKDGRKLENLELNGNNFVSSYEVTREDFRGIESGVTIANSDGTESDAEGLTGEHEHMKLIQIAVYPWEPGKWHFILSDMSESELRELRIDSRLDYIEMMEGLE